ncbi:MAG TPA: glycosyltransferase family 2 protein [Acidimicrobiales bacterium]|nr:glycosyltransferase family 2 protein [Acidimicrobiales bacterium]
MSEGDVQIAPVDRPPTRSEGTLPAEARAPAGGGTSDDGGRDLDPGDLAGPWGLLALAAVGLTVVGATRLRRMVHLWLSPEWLRQGGFGPAAEETTTTFSLLVPARREDPVLGRALDRLAELDHPSFEVLVIVGHDDPATHDIAIAAAARHPDRIRVIAERDFDDSASTALNTALEVCRGEVVGVFEAGDKVHPQLLRHVDACLESTGADVLQGGVQILDLGARWFGIRNVVERYFWFRSRLHFHAHQGFTPLDVSTVFIRTDVVREAGGWDEGCVAENCELGVRLSVDGVATAVAYEPELATRKLCPETTRDLLRQQTRSIQGFLQVARAGVWRRLPERRQRLLARATLLRPLVEALTGVAVLAVVAAALLGGAPLIVVVLALVATVPLLMTVAVEMAGLAELSRTHGSGIGLRDHARLVWSAVPYWLLSAVAAGRALLVYRRQPVGDRAEHHDIEIDGVAGRGVVDLAAGGSGAGVAADARALAGPGRDPGRDRGPGPGPDGSRDRERNRGGRGRPARSAFDEDDRQAPAPPTWPTGWTDYPADPDDPDAVHPFGEGDLDPDADPDLAPPPAPGRGPAGSAAGPGVIPTGRRRPVWTDVPQLTRTTPDR